jgi:hypothetical protein
MPLVQWEDDYGSLYEACIHRTAGNWRGYVKRWSAEGKRSTTMGTHRILWERIVSVMDTQSLCGMVRLIAEQYGCPAEESTQLMEIET